MKLNKILYTALMISSMGSSLSSCKDSFLDEELITHIVPTDLKPKKVSMNWLPVHIRN